ncbi:unnamed protein product [Danaus chrysippus]|uniref:(African queen) hypothetical protein n=1 Tax=Danaus chrysippus TaxID=151541 RepID=A0A8J2RGI4_9NEOP|nr:unnamed protein product [Danaus chrysippus]
MQGLSLQMSGLAKTWEGLQSRLQMSSIVVVCTLRDAVWTWENNFHRLKRLSGVNEKPPHFLQRIKAPPAIIKVLDLGYKEKVRIDLYYEALCPASIEYDHKRFGPLVQILGDYLDVHTYPYGFAQTKEEKGNISFVCQHGPRECYGNKLHACALDKLEHSKAILFNICLMNRTDVGGSDDKTADECGKNMNVDSKPIKLCAKGKKGSELLKYYGEETKKAKIEYVPYTFINGKQFNYGLDYRDFKENYVSSIKRSNTLMSTLIKDLKNKEKVRIDFFYEVLCPGCIYFDRKRFGPLVQSLGDYLDIHTYPYGFAQTKEEKGNISFVCQHGPPECYGNKLHACALDKLEHSKALLFNICLMNRTNVGGSDDKTADECGKNMNVDSKPIKLCAKGSRGSELLKYYGEETKKAEIDYVPYTFINGKEFDLDNDLKKSVCNAFKKPPPPCQDD